MRLEDKVAILTGAASGIGEAVAQRYLDEGARCVLVDLKPAGGSLARLIEANPGRAVAVTADVTRRDDIERIVATTIERFGGVDILFNNAALFDMRPILDESWDVFDRLFSVNVKGLFFLMQAVAQRMVEQGRGGKIVNMSSQAGRRGEALVSHYCATKAALDHHARAVALDANGALRICSVAPGVVDTGMQATIRSTSEDNFPMREKFDQLKSSGALASPEAAARQLIDYALSDAFGAEPTADVRNLPAR